MRGTVYIGIVAVSALACVAWAGGIRWAHNCKPYNGALSNTFSASWISTSICSRYPDSELTRFVFSGSNGRFSLGLGEEVSPQDVLQLLRERVPQTLLSIDPTIKAESADSGVNKSACAFTWRHGNCYASLVVVHISSSPVDGEVRPYVKFDTEHEFILLCTEQ